LGKHGTKGGRNRSKKLGAPEMCSALKQNLIPNHPANIAAAESPLDC
jgi:hypothetical protein